MKPAGGPTVPPSPQDQAASRQPGTQQVAPARPGLTSAITTLKRLRPYAGNVILGMAVLAALAAGITWLAVRPQPRRIEVIIPAPAPVTVQIGGAVISPGIYILPAGSRIADAIVAAGGFAPSADAAALNQAAKLSDGARIDIPSALSAPLAAGTPAQGAQAQPAGTPTRRMDLNTATHAQIESLPGIGPVLAQAIIDFRRKNGPIMRVDQLLAVERIGPKTVEAIRPFVIQP